MLVYVDQRGELLGAAEAGKGVMLRNAALAHYLVVNLGLMEIRTNGRSCRVVFRPEISEPSTLIAALYFLADENPWDITLLTFHNGWHERSFPSLDRFVVFVSAFLDCRGEHDWLAGSRHLRIERERSASLFGTFAEKAKFITQNMDDPEVAVALLRRMLPARWSICTVDHDRMDSIVLAKSADYTPFKSGVLPRSKSSIASYADDDYGRTIAKLHIGAVKAMRDKFEDVDCVARFGGIGDVRMRYHSCTLPVIRPDGSTILICGSHDNSTLDLRQPLNSKSTKIVHEFNRVHPHQTPLPR